MKPVKFEAFLSAEDAARAVIDMRRTRASSKAEYVRNCLNAGTAGRESLLAEQVGLLGIALNAAALAAQSTDPETRKHLAKLARDAAKTRRQVIATLRKWGT